MAGSGEMARAWRRGAGGTWRRMAWRAGRIGVGWMWLMAQRHRRRAGRGAWRERRGGCLTRSLEDFGGALEDGAGDGDTVGGGGLEVEDEVIAGGHLHGDVSGVGAAEDAIGVAGHAVEDGADVNAVCTERAVL